MDNRIDVIKDIENSLKSLPDTNSYKNFIELIYNYETELSGLKTRVSGLESNVFKMSSVLEILQDWILQKGK